ncbi:MAG: carboxypeptidase regulatory-like domain-containing protein [Candidatus Electryonea clarkiae]|nr:carboxypeptidase regulatory-like domain-containing protein [Candidatus Electryonea clarkiae]MDP8289240.1 carboxypeptidase regulatory-like domain-containing protein [Candidatus Electryonea clarkiae]
MHRFKLFVIYSLTLAIASSGLIFAEPASDDVSAWPSVNTGNRYSELDEPYFLVIQNTNPWGATSHITKLNAEEYEYDQITAAGIADADFNAYTVILIPSVQGAAFYTAFENNMDQFEEFVSDGGWLELHGCTQNPQDWELWDGTSCVYQTSTPNDIVDGDHPVVQNINDQISGNHASHNYIDNVPDDANIIMENVNDNPTVIEYTYGGGNVIITTQTVELYAANPSPTNCGPVMLDMIDYCAENAPGVGEADATMEGFVLDSVTGDGIEDAIISAGAARDTTDDEGYYSMENVHSGEGRGVRILKEHYYGFREEIDIETGPNEIDFEITPLATLTGVITDSETDEIVEGAIITWGMHIDTTDVDGNYTLIDMEAAIDTLVIEAEGYFDYEDLEYEVVDGNNEEDFAIDILSGDLTGVVSDELTEEQLFGATITVVDPETGDVYREVTTDETGAYTAPALHDGVTYEVSVTLDGYAPSDVEDVLIRWNRDNEQDFELTPIFELGIRQLQQEQDLETWVLTSGIVTQGTNVTDTEHTSIYIQDDSGWGIAVYSDDPWDPENNINRGDSVTVIGFLIEVDDMNQIINFEIEVNSNDNTLPEPLVETTGDMSGNSQREGTWAQISGQINRDPPGEGTYSLIVNDGSGQCEVQIIEFTGIDLSEFSANDWGTFTGVISLSRQGLRLIPNTQADVARIAIDPPSDLVAEYQTVTGDPLQVEVTLAWSHEHLDEWLRFKVYRDGEHVGNTQQNTWSEKIEDPNPGEFGDYTFLYTVTAVYDEGETAESNEAEVIWSTSVKDRPFSGVPTEWALEAVYPNPFNPTLHVVLGVPQVSNVTVEIMDILGRRVAVLHQGELNAAYHRVGWNATGHPTGLYFLRVTSNTGFNQISKVMFIK